MDLIVERPGALERTVRTPPGCHEPGLVPSASALKDAVNHLAALAIYDGPEHPVRVRVGGSVDDVVVHRPRRRHLARDRDPCDRMAHRPLTPRSSSAARASCSR